jgi:hypothetical protein
MCIIDGQFKIVETETGLKLWTPKCSCAIIDCTIMANSYTRYGWGYEQVKVTQLPKSKPKKKVIQDQFIEQEPDMFISVANAEELVKEPVKELVKEPVKELVKEQTMIELPPEIGMLKQIQDLAGGNLLVALAIVAAIMWQKAQKTKVEPCMHDAKCDKVHAELKDNLIKIEKQLDDVKQVQLNFFDDDKLSKLEEDIKNLKNASK